MTKPESQQELAVPLVYTGCTGYSVVNTCGLTQVPEPQAGWLNKHGYSSGHPRPANLGDGVPGVTPTPQEREAGKRACSSLGYRVRPGLKTQNQLKRQLSNPDSLRV